MKIDTYTYGLGENSVLVVNRAIVQGLKNAGLLRKDHTPKLNPGVDWNAVAKMRDGILPNADAIICQASISLEIMQRVKKNHPDTKIILQRDSTHCKMWKKLVEEEQEKFNIKWEVYPKGLLDRECFEYELADRITVLSRWVQSTFEEYGLKEKTIHVGPQTFDRYRWTKKEDPKGNVFRVLFAGQTGLRKGLFYLLAAWKRLSLKNAELLIAGLPESDSIELKKEINRRIQDTPNTVILNFVALNKMPEVYGNVHVLCIPSIEEGSTMTGLEAMSCGRPVIATKNAGIDILKHWKNGFEVKVRSWESIADAIGAYYNDRKLWKDHAENASKSLDGCDVPEFGKRYAEKISEYLKNA